ncbi:MAG: hypothetical protein NZ736_03185 [Candidatus Poseidoniaceae archaeon]|nr:hypothetical protein [Candidatus Poseidoniaceae archaeon]
MEAVFFGIAITVFAMWLTANYTAKGIGSMSVAMRQFSLFILNKAPAGLVDLFEDKPGSGARTWINFGMLWFVFSSICGFLGLWHHYDPSALDSLASIGWSYDNGDALTATTTKFLGVALFSTLVGAGLVSISRSSGGKMASEASASLSAFLFTLTTIFAALLPSLLGLLGQDVNSAMNVVLIDAISKLAVAMIVAGLFVNVLLTVANRGEEDVSTSAWFLIFALLTFILSMFLGFFGELGGSTQTVWLAGQMGSAWVTLALIFAVAYHIIPMTSGTPIWSGSMRKANLLLLFITLPPFFIASADASPTLLNLGAIVMTLGLLPIIAGSVNLLFTATGNTSAIVKSPGALAATLAMVLMPFYAVGAFFTGMDVFVGTGQLGDMATTVDMGFLWTVGGLMILSGAYISYPLACKKDLAEPSKANLTVWFVLFGGLASTITNLIGDFTIQAVANSGVEDAVAQTEGFYLVGAALFYFTAIAAILATLIVIRTSASKLTSSHAQTSVSDIGTYNLGDGTTTIRTLLGRGVGIDTTLVVGEMAEDEGGSTVIAVSAALHNDEVTEFPEAEEVEEEVVEEEVEEIAKELVMLADYLSNSDQSIFQFFKSIDLDDSGMIDKYEFQQALKSSDIANLPPWEMSSLVDAIDIDGDGQINLPELDIAIAKIRNATSAKESESAVEVPTKAQLNKMKKAELVELATSLGLDASGTKKDLIGLISEA